MQIHFVHIERNILGIPKKFFLVDLSSPIKKIDEKIIDKKTFSFFKALSLNKSFIKDIEKLRTEVGIPRNGYDLIIETNSKTLKIKQEVLFSRDLRSKISPQHIKGIIEDYQIPYMLYSSLKEIIFMNTVVLPIPKLYIDRPYKPFEEINPYSVRIVINDDISKNELKKFIDQNWKEIYQALESQQRGQFYISERDFQIIDLRENKGLTYKAIADVLDDQDEYESIDEDSVKSLYHRARKKIASLKRNKSEG